MNIYEKFETDKNAEVDGIWVELGTGKDDPSFKLGRMGGSNKKYEKTLDTAMAPHRRKMELGVMDEDTAKTVLLDVFSKSVLLDWKNVKDRDGKEIKFSPKKVVEVMSELPDLHNMLVVQAKNADLFKTAQLKSDAGN